jgi:hypothetical protein
MVLSMLQRTGLSNGTVCNRSGGEWKAHAVASKAGSIFNLRARVGRVGSMKVKETSEISIDEISGTLFANVLGPLNSGQITRAEQAPSSARLLAWLGTKKQ